MEITRKSGKLFLQTNLWVILLVKLKKGEHTVKYECRLILRLPKSLHEQLREAAQAEGISVNQFVMLAAAEKVATISAIEYLEKRAKRGSRENFFGIIKQSS